MRKFSTALALGCLLAFPASALAGHGHHQVPPGNSGIDQYTESIPGAGGNHPTSGGGGGGNHSGGGGNAPTVSSSVTQALNSQGAAGQGAANLATGTAPKVRGEATGSGNAGAGGSGGSKGAGHGSANGADEGTGASSAGSGGHGSGADAVAAELTGSGTGNGMGIFLPIILASTLVGALVLVALRLRRGPQQTGS
jgi:hypothetical protein